MEPQGLDSLIERYPQLSPLRSALTKAQQAMYRSVTTGNKILACGNGGSAADAEHVVGELMKSFAFRRPVPADDRALLLGLGDEGAALAEALEVGIPAISLVGQIGLCTAIANDMGYAYVFAQQVYGMGRPGDVLLAISTSGNSKNVLHACQVARVRGVVVIGLTGANGGRMAQYCDVLLNVPSTETHIVQELHLPVYHFLCWSLEAELFGEHGPKA